MTTLEREIGFSLPGLFRRLYLEVADGGFGPGYGLVPIGSSESSNDLAFLELHQDWNAGKQLGPAWCWDKWLVPLCDWGCATYGCLDASEENGAVYYFNWTATEAGDDPDDHLEPTHETLTSWLEDWVEGADCYLR